MGEAGDGGAPPKTTGWINAEDCPSESPAHRTACDLVEGQICVYSEPGEFYRECACRASCGDEGPLVQWNCYRDVAGALRAECPEEQPLDGSDCFGLKGVDCNYPISLQCSCPSEAGDDAWQCRELTGGKPVFPDPNAVDPATVVREMTAADREAWCSWFTYRELAPGFPVPPILEPDPDGYYPDTGCYWGNIDACLVDMPLNLPKEPCVAHLELSSCEATVDELTHCVTAIKAAGHPYPRGCARYLDSPGCLGTLVGPYDSAELSECRVRVVE